MLYRYFRFLTTVSLHLYVKRMGWSGLENVPKGKPILFCSTHSNSFLDALFICCYMDQSVYPLARGDAFKKPFMANILRQFKMLPIYRQQEGEMNAAVKNEQTFKECQNLFRQNEYVLIFPEGICKHQTSLLPLKSGAAVMAQRAWAEGLDVQVVPVGIHYDSFEKWGKKCDITFGSPIQKSDFEDIAGGRAFFAEFNSKLEQKMTTLFPSPYKFKGNSIHLGIFGQIFYYLGLILNFPLYLLGKMIAKKLTANTIFYDSAVLGILVMLLPIYYLLLLGIYLLIR